MITLNLFYTTILIHATNISLLDHCTIFQIGLDFAPFSQTQQAKKFVLKNNSVPPPENLNLSPSQLKVRVQVFITASKGLLPLLLLLWTHWLVLPQHTGPTPPSEPLLLLFPLLECSPPGNCMAHILISFKSLQNITFSMRSSCSHPLQTLPVFFLFIIHTTFSYTVIFRK